MKNCLAWVIGRGGLLGRHLEAALADSGTEIHVPSRPNITWSQPELVREQLTHCIREFASRLELEAPGGAMIYWAAGAGVVSTSGRALADELQTFQHVLAELSGPVSQRRLPTALFMASSAGGVYAGTRDSLVTERSELRPLNDYGRARIEQERALEAFSLQHGSTPCLIGRLSNLYGPGQNLAKPQGLISQMSRAQLLGEAIHIYVSLDTVRDFVYVTDCARDIVRCMDEMLVRRYPGLKVKIFASEEPTSLGRVISLFGRVAERRVRVVSSPSTKGRAGLVNMRFQSCVMRPLHRQARMPLEAGIYFVHQAQKMQFIQGTLGIR